MSRETLPAGPKAAINQDDVAIVIPHKAQLPKLKKLVGDKAAVIDKPGRVHLITADRVQGAERKIIIFLIVNNAKTGAGSV
ncbi:hypothetical protein Daus18300_011747 [Diaporthe australafricana]|uniref:DNA2/NAM7 helicase-like C-terminal domain-containing protein n=1 Tax=Diaporthe australafricana TaxID=127596 RepID=A0ABR3W5T5_9PEZI